MATNGDKRFRTLRECASCAWRAGSALSSMVLVACGGLQQSALERDNARGGSSAKASPSIGAGGKATQLAGEQDNGGSGGVSPPTAGNGAQLMGGLSNGGTGTMGWPTAGNAGTKRCFDFASSAEEWTLDGSIHYVSAAACHGYCTLDPPSESLLSDTTATWSATSGYGGIAGHVRMSIAYSAIQAGTQAMALKYASNAPLQLDGKVITGYVKLVSGLVQDTQATCAGAMPYIKFGETALLATGNSTYLSMNEWVSLEFDMRYPYWDSDLDASLYDPNDIREIGIAVFTCPSVGEVQALGVVLIDHICY